jgi:hypothetical protein
LVAEAGEFFCLLDDRTSDVRRFLGPYEVTSFTLLGALHGQIRVVDSEEIDGSGKRYAAPGKVLRDGVSTVADFSITAGLLSDLNRALELTIESLGEATTLSLTGWDRYYLGDSALTGVSAVYPIFDIFGDPATVSIDANGALLSQAASGCVLSGQIAIIDRTVNVYSASLVASSCSTLNGAYKGLVTVAEIPPDNAITRLKIAVFNDARFIAGDVIGW